MEHSDQNLEDYLSEFEKLIPFDSETCPKCGIKISDTVSVKNSPFVEVLRTSSEDTLHKLCTILENNNIDFKVYKEIDSTSLEQIRYNYRFMVMMLDLEKAIALYKSIQIKNPIQGDRV
jgi:hypothetical protein